MVRKLFLFLALLINHDLIASARAQEPVKEITLTVSPAELNLVSRGLGKIPFEEVAVLMNKLQAQVISQSVPRKPDANGTDAQPK